MGTIFRGWDPKLQRHVALKTVRFAPGRLGSRRRELASQLLREATAAARINHANIVSIYDVEDSPDVAFIAMEFIDGIGLDQLLWRSGAMAPAAACALGARIGEALAASHQVGVVHRDVKPANVLLGFDGAVKVADFGIAEFLSSMATDNDSFFGTPGYVPPETLRGNGYDPLGDLFSLGVVLYQCLTEKQPFAGKNLRDTALRTLRHDPTHPSLLNPQTPPALDQLVMQLLSKNPLLRPQSARQTIDSLRNASPDPTLQWSAEHLPRGQQPVPPHTVPRSQLVQTRVVEARQGASA
jgi:serine/threonine-protein kinase